MAKGKGLSPTKRAENMSMFNNAKLSKRDIARRLGISDYAVRNTLLKFEIGDGTPALYSDTPRSGSQQNWMIGRFGD